jgi:hypothetical protein
MFLTTASSSMSRTFSNDIKECPSDWRRDG